MTRTIRRLPLYVIALVASVLALYPFVFMVQAAFRPQSEYLQAPLTFTLPPFFGNLDVVFNTEFARFFANSIVVSTLSVVIATFIGAMAAYALSLMNFRLSRPMYLLFIAGLMIPVHAVIIPIFVLTLDINLYNTIWALLGPYIGFSLPITILILTEFFAGVPREILEAASVDGAGHWKKFRTILLPIAKPALSTVGIYNLIFIWNEFIFALTLTSTRDNATLPVGLRTLFGQYGVNIPAVMMALTAASLPVLIFYFFAQERVIEGLTAGANK